MSLDNFTSDNSSTVDSSGNKRKSQMFTRDRFEEVLDETEYKWQRKDYDWAKEWIYEAESDDGKFTMRVYSSVDKRSDKSREKDSDAIRLTVIHTESGWPVMSEKRTNRIKTWPKNLKKKIANIKDRKDEVTFCDDCGSIMLIRENKENGDKFYGCIEYPECKNTEPLN